MHAKTVRHTVESIMMPASMNVAVTAAGVMAMTILRSEMRISWRIVVI
jgi:hypothetical protein